MFTLCTNKSISVRELASTIGVSVRTAWGMQHKLRMYMHTEDIDLSGVVCMDEAHIGGWSGMHLNKKMEYMRKNNYLDTEDKYYHKRAIYAASSEKKHHIISIINNKKPIPMPKKIIQKDYFSTVFSFFSLTTIVTLHVKLS